MQSLTEEIQSFSRSRLRRQCTRVTSLSGRRIVETWKGCTVTVEEEEEEPGSADRAPGYVPDTSWDLQVGAVRPDLLLGRCPIAHQTRPDGKTLAARRGLKETGIKLVELE